MFTIGCDARNSHRYLRVGAALLLAVAVAASGCSPESSLTDIECESDADCQQRGSECDDGYCVVVDTQQSELTVEVDGLPVGVEADVGVEGPEGFEHRVSSTETIDRLWAGDYTVVAETVETDSTTWDPDVEEQTIALEVDDSQTATVDYGVRSGGVELMVGGLPDGADPTIELLDDDGELVEEFGDDFHIGGLQPGDYTVAPGQYEDEGRTYGANSVDIEVSSGETTPVDIDYVVDPGTVVVNVSGLAEGASPNIDLVGEDNTYSVSHEGDRLEGVEPGSYSLEPQSANLSGDWDSTYRADNQDVEVASNDETVVDVDYEVVPGTVDVEISGLDAGDPTVELVDAFGETIGERTGEGEIEADPGIYTVEPSPYQDGGNEWVAESVEVTIDSDETTDVELEYSAEPGSVAVEVVGLPTGVEPDLVVAADDSDDEWDVPSDGTVGGLAPGDYTLQVGDVDEPDDGPRSWTGEDVEGITVTSHDTTDVVANYEVITGELTVGVVGLDGGGPADLQIEGPETDENISLGEGEQWDDDEAVPGDYTITPDPFEHEGSTYSATVRIEEVRSGQETDVTIEYQVAAGFGAMALGISGLDGYDADVEVLGEDDFDSGTITGSQTLEGLTPGEYEVRVNTVEGEFARYLGDDLPSVDVESGQTTYVEIEYEAEEGELTVETVEPEGIGVRAQVVDGDGLSQLFEATDRDDVTESLEPGSYTVDFERIGQGEDVAWDPVEADASQSVDVYSDGHSNQTDDVGAVYEIVEGTLTLTVDGLEAGSTAEIDVDGGAYDNETFQITQGDTELIDDAEPDDYTVTPQDYEEDGIVWEADPQTVSVTSDGQTDVTVDYEADVGALAVGIDGLDDGLAADVVVRHSDTQEIFRELTESETLEDVPSGDYDIDVEPVEDSPERYTGEDDEVTVSKGETAFVEIGYELELGEMRLLVEETGGLGVSAHLEDPDGVTRSIESDETDTTVEDLDPGDYGVEFQRLEDGNKTYDPVDVDPESPVTVFSDGFDEETSVTASYEVVPGSFEIEVDGLEEDQEIVAELLESPDEEDKESAERGLNEDFYPGDYTVEFGVVDVDDNRDYAPEPAEVEFSVDSDATTGVDVGYEVIPGNIEVGVTGLEGNVADIDIVDDTDDTVETLTTDDSAVSGDLEPGEYDVDFPDEIQNPEEDRTYELVDAADSVQEVDLVSGETPERTADYELTDAPGTLTVDLFVPDEDTAGQDVTGTAQFEVDNGSETETFDVEPGANFETFELETGDYDISPVSGTIDDSWGNEIYLERLAAQGLTVEMEEETQHSASVELPTEVVESDDDLSLRGSLREVVDRVADTSIVVVDGIDEISLTEGQISLDRPLEIRGEDVTVGTEDETRLLEVTDLDDGDHVALEEMTLTKAEGVDRGAGLNIDSAEGSISVYDVDFTGLQADAEGGALSVEAAAEVYVDGSTFENNSADNGGAVYLNPDAEVGFSRVVFDNNDADSWSGGAVHVEGMATFHEAYFADNTAPGEGGAVYLSQLEEGAADIAKALFESNEADDGGAIYAGGQLRVENSTFSANLADETDGAGGAIYFGDQDQTGRLLQTTMVENVAAEGGAIWTEGSDDIRLKSSYLNANTGPADYDIHRDVDWGGADPVESAGYNFVETTNGMTVTHFDDDGDTDITDEESDYEDLARQDSGDFTAVHALPEQRQSDGEDNPGYLDIPGGECVDFDGDSVLTDQRDADRPYQGWCSRGAWEEDGS